MATSPILQKMQNCTLRRASARRAAVIALSVLLTPVAEAAAQFANLAVLSSSLRGSKASIAKMYNFALRHDFHFARTASDVDSLASAGRLIPLSGSFYYEVSAAVGFAYATPEARALLEGIAPRFLEVCDTPLVVTSATRPQSRQPRNAAELSVHPTGIAVDIRRPPPGPCLNWLRDTLLVLEADGVIEVTEERNPPHFHIAALARPGSAPVPGLIDRLIAQQLAPVSRERTTMAAELDKLDGQSLLLSPLFNAPLLPSESLAALMGMELLLDLEFPNIETETIVSAGDVELPADTAVVDSVAPSAPAAAKPASSQRAKTHIVRTGDTLWDIARKHGLSVGELQRANNMGKRSRIKPGLTLKIPS